MNKIIVKGKLPPRGKTTAEVEMKDGELIILFDGEEDPMMEFMFRDLISDPPSMGGTYYPPVNSLLNALNVLRTEMFESVESVETIGDIGTVPFEEGDDNIY